MAGGQGQFCKWHFCGATIKQIVKVMTDRYGDPYKHVCVILMVSFTKPAVSFCHTILSFVPTPTPGNSSSCYLFVNTRLRWQRAQQYCVEHGGFLARPDTLEKNTQLKVSFRIWTIVRREAIRFITRYISVSDFSCESCNICLIGHHTN